MHGVGRGFIARGAGRFSPAPHRGDVSLASSSEFGWKVPRSIRVQAAWRPTFPAFISHRPLRHSGERPPAAGCLTGRACLPSLAVHVRAPSTSRALMRSLPPMPRPCGAAALPQACWTRDTARGGPNGTQGTWLCFTVPAACLQVPMFTCFHSIINHVLTQSLPQIKHSSSVHVLPLRRRPAVLCRFPIAKQQRITG